MGLAATHDELLAQVRVRPADLERSCDDSLARLGTDRLDLYQTHWFADRGVPIADTWGAMLELVRKGKARAVGVCIDRHGLLPTRTWYLVPADGDMGH